MWTAAKCSLGHTYPKSKLESGVSQLAIFAHQELLQEVLHCKEGKTMIGEYDFAPGDLLRSEIFSTKQIVFLPDVQYIRFQILE